MRKSQRRAGGSHVRDSQGARIFRSRTALAITSFPSAKPLPRNTFRHVGAPLSDATSASSSSRMHSSTNSGTAPSSGGDDSGRRSTTGASDSSTISTRRNRRKCSRCSLSKKGIIRPAVRPHYRRDTRPDDLYSRVAETSDVVQALLAQTKIHRLLLILDACYAGAVAKALLLKRSTELLCRKTRPIPVRS
jgi:hypothetical protein